MNHTVAPAMKAISEELQNLSFEANVRQKISPESGAEGWGLTVAHHGEYQDFSYQVYPIAENRPMLTPVDSERPDNEIYYRAEVYLNEGGQDYDIMGWTKEDIIADILDQYERHRHFLHMVHDNEVVPDAEPSA